MGTRTIIICDSCERELEENEEYAFVEVKSEIDGRLRSLSKKDRASVVWCLGCHGARWPGIKHTVEGVTA